MLYWLGKHPSQAFNSARAQGWTLVAVSLPFQSDNFQCGVWVQKVTDAFLDYVAGGCMAGNNGVNFVG